MYLKWYGGSVDDKVSMVEVVMAGLGGWDRG